MAEIDRLLPEDAPMSTTTLRRLAWPALRQAAYQASFGATIPEVTPMMLCEWRTAQHLSRQQVGQQLGIHASNVGHWEEARQPIPLYAQHALWCWMQEEKEEKNSS